MTDSLVRRRAGRLGIQTPIRPGFALVIGLVLGLGPAGAAAATEPGGVWPLTPRPAVVRGFEPPPEPWLPGHRGVDLLGSVGRQVRAASAGTILYAGPLAGRGVVVISHGATRTTYEPLVASVRAGDPVLAGDPIGTLSAAPSHCAPRVCLHWGLLRGSTYLDPLSLLTASPVRLLPTASDHLPADTAGAARRRAAPADETDTDPHGPRASADPTTGNGPPAGDDQPGGDGQRGGDGRYVSTAGTSGAGGVVVAVAALLTVAGGLLIRRH
jgi:hypothetical protein